MKANPGQKKKWKRIRKTNLNFLNFYQSHQLSKIPKSKHDFWPKKKSKHDRSNAWELRGNIICQQDYIYKRKPNHIPTKNYSTCYIHNFLLLPGNLKMFRKLFWHKNHVSN